MLIIDLRLIEGLCDDYQNVGGKSYQIKGKTKERQRL